MSFVNKRRETYVCLGTPTPSLKVNNIWSFTSKHVFLIINKKGWEVLSNHKYYWYNRYRRRVLKYNTVNAWSIIIFLKLKLLFLSHYHIIVFLVTRTTPPIGIGSSSYRDWIPDSQDNLPRKPTFNV